MSTVTAIGGFDKEIELKMLKEGRKIVYLDDALVFDEKIQNNDLVYLDSANSSQKPKVVIDRINEFYTKQFSNVGRSVHYLAVAATNLYEETRSSVQKYINARDKNEIVFTKGATEALNLVANTLGQNYLQEGDEVLLQN